MVESPSQPQPSLQQSSDLLDDPVVVAHEEVPLVTSGVETNVEEEEGSDIPYEPEFEPAFSDNTPGFDSTTAGTLVDNALAGEAPTETNPDAST